MEVSSDSVRTASVMRLRPPTVREAFRPARRRISSMAPLCPRTASSRIAVRRGGRKSVGKPAAETGTKGTGFSAVGMDGALRRDLVVNTVFIVPPLSQRRVITPHYMGAAAGLEPITARRAACFPRRAVGERGARLRQRDPPPRWLCPPGEAQSRYRRAPLCGRRQCG